MPINDLAKLRQEYAAFRRDPMARFIVEVRRTRASQIRAQMANPEALADIETYEREVWRIEDHTYLRNKQLKLHIFTRSFEQTRLLKAMAEYHLTLDDLTQALHSGQLELHGNYIFGQTSAIFFPQFQDRSLSFSYIKQAFRHLNDTTLTPVERVQRVYDTKGFGENNATGLGMIFHPGAIGLVNRVTRELLQKMGYTAAETKSWRELQDVLRSLHIVLRTRDYIELDWFLYVYSKSFPSSENAPQADEHIHTDDQHAYVPLEEVIGPIQHPRAGFIPAGYKIVPLSERKFNYYKLVNKEWVPYGNGQDAWYRRSWERAGKAVRDLARDNEQPLGSGGALHPEYGGVVTSDAAERGHNGKNE